ncbi:transposase [Nitrosomonas communis]|uniref:transposase n=1 Tax=Nitrosomonas communis TaxID=44574 RepID=UPI003D29A413
MEAHLASGQINLVQDVQIHLDWLNKQIKELERKINDHIDRHPDLKCDAELLRSIPGIGATTVAKVLAYAGDVRRFTNAKALAAFIGVTPRQRISVSSVKGRTMMSRTGHNALRHALYMTGLVARHHNPVLKTFSDRLSTTGLAPKAIVGAVMRKLAHLIYGVIKSGQPFDANFNHLALVIQDGI